MKILITGGAGFIGSNLSSFLANKGAKVTILDDFSQGVIKRIKDLETELIKGKVEDTIPLTVPPKIALLRLDTDWYESTYHELKYLFPLLSNKGALIIDDYGCWAGAKKAVDTYFDENKIVILLNRIDYTVRLGIKV